MSAPSKAVSGAPTLEVRKLRTVFDTRAGEVAAVNEVSFTLERGRVLGLVGESGSGKSVTGFSIMGLVDAPGRIAGGEILFQGRDLAKLRREDMRQLRGNRIAMVFQDPMMTLNPVLRVDKQMIEAVQAHQRVSHAVARDLARDTLGLMGIASPDERLLAYPHQLSGGMRQRVAIAIAMLHRPDLIIADLRLRGSETGIDAIAALRATLGPVPALLISGDTAPERLTLARDAGIRMCHKPLTMEKLSAELRLLMPPKG